MQHACGKEYKIVRFEADFSRDLSMNGKIILKLTLIKYGMDLTDFYSSGSGLGPTAGSYEHKISSFIKHGKFLEQLGHYQLPELLSSNNFSKGTRYWCYRTKICLKQQQLHTLTVRPNYPRNRPWRPLGCETSRFPHFLDNRLIDGDEVSLTRRPPYIHYSFLLEAESTPGP
jgi:hypothetical protein